MIKRYLGIAEETAYNQEASNIEHWLDPSQADLDPAGDDKLIWEGMSGLDRLVAAGSYSTSGNITIPFDKKIAPWFIKWALGSVETSGADPTYTHIFKPSQEPLMKSFTAVVGKDIMEHVFTGNVVSQLEISADTEWIQMAIQAAGAQDKKAPLRDPAPVFNEGEVFPAHMLTIDLNETDQTAKVEELSLTINTGASVEDGMGPGSRFPKRGYKGTLLVEMSLTLGFYDTDELVRFWGGSDGPSSTVSEFGATIHIGNDVEITIPRMVYTAMDQPVSGRDRIEQSATVRGLVDPVTGEGPVIITVTNDVASY